MSKFDYEAFLKKIHENNVAVIDCEDGAAFYEDVYNHKENQRVYLKTQLDALQKTSKALKKNYELSDAFNRKLLRTRDSIIQANAVLYESILEAEESRREALAKHVDVMEKLEQGYLDFARVRCDSDSLKTKLAELKEKKSALQEEMDDMSEELQRITDSMKKLNVPLPNAEAMKRIAEEVLTQCGDLSVKQQELEKMKRFLKDFQEKINSS